MERAKLAESGAGGNGSLKAVVRFVFSILNPRSTGYLRQSSSSGNIDFFVTCVDWQGNTSTAEGGVLYGCPFREGVI